MMIVNIRLKDVRVKNGMTQADVANVLQVSKKNVENWESGKQNPRTRVVLKYAKYFHVSTDYLLGLKDS